MDMAAELTGMSEDLRNDNGGVWAASARGQSVPPTGTPKADEAAARHKASAVATLQKLFFEEMSKGCGDANEAAARALRRLTWGPTPDAADAANSSLELGGTSVAKARQAEVCSEILEVGEEATPCAPATETATSADAMATAGIAARPTMPVMPQRPKDTIGRRRRPSPYVRVAN